MIERANKKEGEPLKKALITGITGQDGSYLAEFLMEKGYEVHGVVRRSSSFNRGRIEHLRKNPKIPYKKIHLHYGDMTDTPSLSRLMTTICPDEVYNLAAQSHVGISFKTPEYTGQTDAMGALRILEAIVSTGLQDTCRYYQASTSELYGQVKEVPQTEATPFHPRSPYAVAKLYAHWITINYREAFGLFALNGIMFNHESPRRGENFVTRKITLSLANILSGEQEKLSLGNLNSKRDWGYAKDYVEGMWLALQQDIAEDYVFATGIQKSIRDFVKDAFGNCGFDIEWQGEGLEEKGVDRISGRVLIDVDPEFFRPAEVDLLVGDASKARKKLGWEPRTSYSDLVQIMVKNDLLCNGLDPTKIMISKVA
jgi:GDPmannose 4,6-dehydratase